MTDDFIYVVQPLSTAYDDGTVSREYEPYSTIDAAKVAVQTLHPGIRIEWRDYPDDDICVAACEIDEADEAYQIDRCRVVRREVA